MLSSQVSLCAALYSWQIGPCLFDCRNVRKNRAKCQCQTFSQQSISLSICPHTHTYTLYTRSISYLHWSYPKTALLRKPNMFLNPPAVKKSILFCSQTLKKIANIVSSVQFSQLNCSLVLIQKTGWMADEILIIMK